MITYHRPAIQNGRIAKRARRPAPTAATVSDGLAHAFNSTARAAGLTDVRATQASAALPILIVCGLLLASGFVYSLWQHFTSARLVRESVMLRNDADRAATGQRNLQIDHAQASSPEQLEQRLAGSNLSPLQFDQTVAAKPKTEPVQKANRQNRDR
jgi:hypothetical protein